MANYNYDESGSMVLYFIITILFMVLVPLTLSFLSSSSKFPLRRVIGRRQIIGSEYVASAVTSACECQPCVEQHARIKRRDKGSFLQPKLTKRYGRQHLALVCDGLMVQLTQGHIYNCRVDSACTDIVQGRKYKSGQQSI